MKGVGVVLALALLGSTNLNNDSTELNDHKIAKAVRNAVRVADSTLLNKNSLGDWRNYLKLATIDLEPELRPLVLINFDEDVHFRNQLKKLIEYEENWQKKETDHYLYYYQWEQPPPDILLSVQETHFRKIAGLFGIVTDEKIPYRYNPDAPDTQVFPFEELMGGIVSHLPLDLESSAKAVFYLISAEPQSIIEPLTRIYGNYFQEHSTSESYYEMCLGEIKKMGYVPAIELYSKKQIDKSLKKEWYSSFVFVYNLDRDFGPTKVARFLGQAYREMPAEAFLDVFRTTFGVVLTDYENTFIVPQEMN